MIIFNDVPVSQKEKSLNVSINSSNYQSVNIGQLGKTLALVTDSGIKIRYDNIKFHRALIREMSMSQQYKV